LPLQRDRIPIIVKLTVTNNAVAVVEDALSLAEQSRPVANQSAAAALSRRLVRRVHTPQDDTPESPPPLALGL
jgi:hypothetical protein